MNATPHEAPPPAKWRHTLLVLLAAPLALSAVLLAAWIAGGRQPWGSTAGGEMVLATLVPISMTWSALSLLQNPSARSLVLPTPIMMSLVFMAQRKTEVSWHWVLLANIAWLVLLGACWRGDRRIARWATICCGMLALWLQLAAVKDKPLVKNVSAETRARTAASS